MDENSFVLKYEHFLKERLFIFIIPWSILFAKTHEKWNNRLCFIWMNLQKKIWMKKTMF